MRNNTTQIQANAIAQRIQVQDEQSYIGTFKIRLESISCPEIPLARASNVARIGRIFRIQGCLRLARDNYITASIETADDLNTHAPLTEGEVPELVLPLARNVLCLHGKCRIAAARELLHGRDRWWIARLYHGGRAQPIESYLQDEFHNEQAPSDGLVYRKVTESRRTGDTEMEARWLSFLRPSKQRYLKLLTNSHRDLATAFERCLEWPSLWSAMRIGVLHKVIAQRADEEMIAYLGSIQHFYSSLNTTRGASIDETFVKAIEGRCPHQSRGDELWISQYMEINGVVGEAQADIVAWIRTQPLLIPSLFTFFEDYKYTSLCSQVLKRLVSGDKRRSTWTLRQAFREIFTPSHMAVTQLDHNEWKVTDVGSEDVAFMWSYQQVWLCSMRACFFCVREYPRQTPIEKRDWIINQQEHSWQYVARTVQKLGFSSSQLDDLVHDLGFVPQSLTAHGNQGMDFEYEEGAGTSIKKDASIIERCGIPCFKDIYDDHKNLFIERLLRMNESGINALFSRQSLFFRLFPSTLDIASHLSSPVTREVQSFTGKRTQTRQPASMVATLLAARDPMLPTEFRGEWKLHIFRPTRPIETRLFESMEGRARFAIMHHGGWKFLAGEGYGHISVDELNTCYEETVAALDKHTEEAQLRTIHGIAADSGL